MSQQEFDHYLSLLARMLKLTPTQREEIADELRTHLEERLADLQADGHDRDAAIRLALDEFGDASVLAHDFTETAQRAKHQRSRRRLMQTTAGTLIAAAVVTFAVMTLTPNNFKGMPTQAPAKADQDFALALANVDQVSLETRLVLIDPVEADALRKLARDLSLPGFQQAVALKSDEVENQAKAWLESPSAMQMMNPRVTTFVGQPATVMVATASAEHLPGDDHEQPVVNQTRRGVSLGFLAMPSPDEKQMRYSVDLQTVWSEILAEETASFFHNPYGELQPAVPMGAGWSPGITGLRFQVEAEPKEALALKLPISEAQLGLSDEPQDREVWLLMKATLIQQHQ